MYLHEDTAHEALTSLQYVQKHIKPWNVKEGDVILLEDSTRYNMPTIYVPVEVTILDYYADFWRDAFTHKISRKTFRFYHKPLIDADRKYMFHWWTTQWKSTDTVEIYRKHA